MTTSIKEKDFETHIEEYLLSHNYSKALPEIYNRTQCLLTEELIAFVKATQPKEYEKLEIQYGANTAEKFCQNLSAEISRNGTLHVLRKGFTDRGAKFRFAYFQPSSGMNPEHQQLYAKNILTVVRQLKYSTKNENSIDMVLFLNGIPIITMELKNSLTGQFVEDAVKQYKYDRSPNESLLQFKRCLVHFAVGNEKVFMTTKLENGKTFFLPFNKGTDNPINQNGFQTAYLWEDILEKNNLLDIIQNYLQLVTEKVYVEGKGIVEKSSEVFIFPRYHQLNAVRTIIHGVKNEGSGENYLVQHSGSGKSNTIAWLSHSLASLYQSDKDTKRIFDSIIVVTDRRIFR